MKKNIDKKLYFEIQIIGGELKGKKILIPNIKTTRSTKSIMRESLFNTLQFEIVGKNFVEVFAGSGSIGLEALSRGAKNVYFMEKNQQAYAALKENISRVNKSNIIAINTDSFTYFETIHASLKKDQTKTYFYFDPPFNIREGMDDIYDKTTDLISSIDISICEMVIIEHISTLELPEQIGQLKISKQKRFGKSTLSYYKPL